MLRLLRTIADYPLTPVLLICLLVADLWSLGSRYQYEPTFTARLVGPLIVRPRKITWNMPAAIICRDTDDSYVLLLEHEWDSRPDLMIDSRMVDHLLVSPRVHMQGLYAGTRSVQNLLIRNKNGSPLVPSQLTNFRGEFMDACIAMNAIPADLTTSERAALTSGKSVVRTTIRPLGYLHNTLSLFMFAMLCWSLSLNIPKLWRRRIDPTKCPHCRYSTIGLTTNTCPECGNCISTSD